MPIVRYLFVLCISSLACAGSRHVYDPRVNDECVLSILKKEKQYNIRKNLLLAIANVESGMTERGHKKKPWPWTICVKKKAHYFQTAKDAEKYFQELIDSGVSNIDVGCMQINMRAHPNAMVNKRSVFNVDENVDYAARLLCSLYKRYRCWEKAAGYYHTCREKLRRKYSERVFDELKRLDADDEIECLRSDLHDGVCVEEIQYVSDDVYDDKLIEFHEKAMQYIDHMMR